MAPPCGRQPWSWDRQLLGPWPSEHLPGRGGHLPFEKSRVKGHQVRVTWHLLNPLERQYQTSSDCQAVCDSPNCNPGSSGCEAFIIPLARQWNRTVAGQG
jgi:hypothetical protein